MEYLYFVQMEVIGGPLTPEHLQSGLARRCAEAYPDLVFSLQDQRQIIRSSRVAVSLQDACRQIMLDLQEIIPEIRLVDTWERAPRVSISNQGR